MNADHLITIDAEFDNLDHLNISIEQTRKILDEFVSQNKVENYYLMRYNFPAVFLGIKIILVNLDFKEEVISILETRLKSFLGFREIRKIEQDSITDQIGKDSFLASIGMRTRNEIYDILKRKPSNEELLNFFHYLCNPLEMDYREEAIFCSYLIKRYFDERKI